MAATASAQTENPAKEYEQAKAFIAAGKYDLAIPIYQKLVRAQPKNPELRGAYADALLTAGRFESAAAQFRELSNSRPDDPRVWYGLGLAYQGIAGAALDRLQKLDAKSPYLAALIADSVMQRRQYRSAFFFYSEAFKQLPNLHGIHASLAEVYRKTGHPDWAAIEDGKEAALPAADCKAHPAECEFVAGHDVQLVGTPRPTQTSAETLYWQAKAANELALQALFRLGQMPPSVEMHRVKAEIARAQRQHLESVQEWRAALALAPNDPDLKREIAVSLFMAGSYRDALEEAKKLAHSPEIEFLIGDSLLRLEQPEEAIPHLRSALAGDPKMLAADASLGLALARTGKNGEAVPHLQKALSLDEDGSLHFQLANAYRAAGDAEKARTAMAQYQEIVKRNQEQKDEVTREAQITPPK